MKDQLSIPDNDTTSESKRNTQTRKEVQLIVVTALQAQKENSICSLIEKKHKQAILDSYGEVQERAIINTYTSIYKVIKQAAVKELFSKAANDRFGTDIAKIEKAQHFIQELDYHSMQPRNLTKPGNCMFKQCAEKSYRVK